MCVCVLVVQFHRVFIIRTAVHLSLFALSCLFQASQPVEALASLINIYASLQLRARSCVAFIEVGPTVNARGVASPMPSVVFRPVSFRCRVPGQRGGGGRGGISEKLVNGSGATRSQLGVLSLTRNLLRRLKIPENQYGGGAANGYCCLTV